MQTQDILDIVYGALDELQAQNPALPPIPRQPETRLYGEGGLLDSLSLVSLIVSVTEAVQDRYDADLTLVDEKAFSDKRSPFRSVAALAGYVAERLAEARADAQA